MSVTSVRDNVSTSSASQQAAAAGKFDYNRIQGVQGNRHVTPAFIREVEAMARASTDNSLAFYRRCPDLYPCWGKWLAHYGI